MKIYFNEMVKYTAWGGGMHFLANLVEYLRNKGHKVIYKLRKNIDLIFLLTNFRELNPKILKYKKKNQKTKILQRINISDISKNTTKFDDLVLRINKIADETIFISDWLAKYYINKGFNKSYHVIHNGCNSNYFFPAKNKNLGERINLVTHHWSNNWMKGFDIYNELDKIISKTNLTFTYIGRYNDKYTPKNTKIIPPLYGKELGDELRKCDIYVTAARWEACGMHHIEGACCGLPILYHKEGGGINELCKNYGIEFSDIETLFDGIDKIKNSYQKFRKKIQFGYLSSKRCNEEYYKVIQNLSN